MSDAMRPVKIGLIGLGPRGETLLASMLQLVGEVDLVAICDLDPTHGLGPIAKILASTAATVSFSLTATASKARGFAAAWMSISCLSEQSIAMGGMPVPCPDFTNGKWINRPPALRNHWCLDEVCEL